MNSIGNKFLADLTVNAINQLKINKISKYPIKFALF